MNVKTPASARRLYRPGSIATPSGPAAKEMQGDVPAVQPDWFGEVRAASLGTIEAMLRADPERAHCTDDDGASAMMLAIRLGHVDVVALLRNHCADVLGCAEHPNDRHAVELVEAALRLQASRIAPSEFAERLGNFHRPGALAGRNALTYAVACGAGSAIIELLAGPRPDEGASVPIDRLNVLDGLGQSPLSLAVDKCNEAHVDPSPGYEPARRESLSLVAVLLSLGAKPDLKDGRQHTALLLAARVGNTALVDLLLTKGARASSTALGEALEMAVVRGHAPVAECLLSHNAAADWNGIERLRLLSAAIRPQSAACFAALWPHWRANVLGSRQLRGRLLLAAAAAGRDDVARAIIRKPVEPRALIDALGAAVRRGHGATIRVLLAHAPSAVADANGVHLLAAAVESGQAESFQLLLQCGAGLDKKDPQNLVSVMAAFGHWHLVNAVLGLYPDPGAVLAQALTEIDSVEGTRKLLELGAGNARYTQAVITAIKLAASTGNAAVAELLLASEAASAMSDGELAALKSAIQVDRLLSASGDTGLTRVLDLFDKLLKRRRHADL